MMSRGGSIGVAAHAHFRLASRGSEKEPKMNSSTREDQTLPAIQLPLPASDRGISVFAALQQRKTTREISATPLPLQLLSNLLWAAFGVNRKDRPVWSSGQDRRFGQQFAGNRPLCRPPRGAPTFTRHSAIEERRVSGLTICIRQITADYTMCKAIPSRCRGRHRRPRQSESDPHAAERLERRGRA